jgi:hypothetical protein
MWRLITLSLVAWIILFAVLYSGTDTDGCVTDIDCVQMYGGDGY